MKIENQHTEFKRLWRDDFLKSICAFANAQGGTLYIGLSDSGDVTGIDNHKKLLEELPNKIRDILGLFPQINHKIENGKNYLTIVVDPSKNPVSYHGHFYYRSGSTIQDLSGGALEHFLLAKRGKKWDGIIATNFSMNDLSENAFSIFREKAKRSKRIPDEDLNTSNEELLKALKLTDNNQLTRAAALCFGKDGEKLITGAFVKIGFFRTHSDLLYQDIIQGSLIEQVEKTIDLLTTKYMKANIDYKGITRTETYDYPEKALREAVLNAIIHKDYSSNVPVQISVYERWLLIYNRGSLPEGWTLDTLKQKHSSVPANPDIARVFFRAGYIENWGRGIRDMIHYFTQAGLPEPFYKEMGAGDDRKTTQETTQETIQETTQETTQEKLARSASDILVLIKKNPKITRKEMAKELDYISEEGIKYHLAKLKEQGFIKRKGSTKSGMWIIVKNY